MLHVCVARVRVRYFGRGQTAAHQQERHGDAWIRMVRAGKKKTPHRDRCWRGQFIPTSHLRSGTPGSISRATLPLP
jgi:hypothetical protein